MYNAELLPSTMARRYHPVDEDPQRSLASFISHIPSIACQNVAPVSQPYSRQLAFMREGKLLQRRPHRGIFPVGAVATILPLVMILALLALCRTSQRSVSNAAAHRNLSDTEDEQARSDLLEQCLDLEGELGLRPAASNRDEEENEAKGRLVSMLRESATAFERMWALPLQSSQDEVQLHSDTVPQHSESWVSTPHPQAYVDEFWTDSSGMDIGSVVGAFDLDAFPPADSLRVLGRNQQQQHSTKLNDMPAIEKGLSTHRTRPLAFYEAEVSAKPLASSTVGAQGGGEDVPIPDAWLYNNLGSTYSQAFKYRVLNTVWRNPKVTAASASATTTAQAYNDLPDKVGCKTPHADAAQDRLVPSIQAKTLQQVEHPKDLSGSILNASAITDAATAVRATFSGQGGSCGAGGIRLHPFVRLPVVNPADVRRSFREEFALSLDLNDLSPMNSYTTMRSLFAKASLTAQDVEILMTEAELLANYAAHKVARTHTQTKANFIARKLSSVFMVFDYLVCTIELLGEKMNTGRWWGAFVQKFRTDYAFPEEARTERTQVLNRLVNRLSSALAVYKTGKRPSFMEIIELKRIILSQSYKGSQFTHPLWKLWIQDDREFSCSSDDIQSLSGVQVPSQRKKKRTMTPSSS